MRRFAADTMTWADDKGFAIEAAVDERMGFIRRTYAHLVGEIVLVGLVTTLVLRTPLLLENVAWRLLGSPFLYLAAFFGVSLVTRRLMAGHKPAAIQYAGAGLWTFFLGLLVAPIALIVHNQTGSYAILGQAFLLTALVFTGLTAYVFTTRKDFSFLGGAISIIAMVLIGGAVLGFFLGASVGGIGWSVVWVLLLGAWVLYDTSKVLHHRRVGEHVAASVDLLIDFVYMFIHIALILLRSRD
jgi:FtsH-binding integral membrane protein